MSKYKRKPLKQLGNKLIIFPNPEKKHNEKWFKGRNACNLICPSRIVMVGKPHSGKTNTVRNIIHFAHPPYKNILLYHCDLDLMKEYKDSKLKIKYLDVMPSRDEIPKGKTLFILDDIDFTAFGKEEKQNFNCLYKNWSSHFNITTISCAHNFFELPKSVRRCTNVFILWNNPDVSYMKNISARVSLSVQDMDYMFKLCKDPVHHAVWLDYTEKSPYKYRINCFEKINELNKHFKIKKKNGSDIIGKGTKKRKKQKKRKKVNLSVLNRKMIMMTERLNRKM